MEMIAPDMIGYVNRLEQEMAKLPQADCPVWHHFAPGLYARKMLIPKGVTLTGAVHKTEHLCIVSGAIQVTTDDGVAFICDQQHIFKSMPGTKRAGYALADTYWTTIHATEETDLDKLVEELCDCTADQLLGGSKNIQLLNNRSEEKLCR